jgi:hypothetical protein
MKAYDFIRYRSVELLLDESDPGASLAEYLAHQPCVHIEDLCVELSDGVATIRGRCGSPEERERAAFILGNVVGIHRVVDAMEAPEQGARQDEPAG